MCKRPDCPNPGRANHLIHKDEAAQNPIFTPELDMMPDGFHAKPLRLWAAKKQKLRVEPTIKKPDLDELREQRRKQYAEIPDPKPNYFDWLALMDEEDRFWDAYWIRKTAMYPSDRLKAIAHVNESAKSKPKQSLEILGGAKDVDLDDLLARILRAKGVPEEQIVALVAPKVQ